MKRANGFISPFEGLNPMCFMVAIITENYLNGVVNPCTIPNRCGNWRQSC